MRCVWRRQLGMIHILWVWVTQMKVQFPLVASMELRLGMVPGKRETVILSKGYMDKESRRQT